MMSKSPRTFYTEEFKESSAILAVESDQTIAQTAKDLGIKLSTLHGWISKYVKKKDKDKMRNKVNLEEENKKLRKQLSIMQQERDILKKAAAFFAKEAQ